MRDVDIADAISSHRSLDWYTEKESVTMEKNSFTIRQALRATALGFVAWLTGFGVSEAGFDSCYYEGEVHGQGACLYVSSTQAWYMCMCFPDGTGHFYCDWYTAPSCGGS